MEDKAKQLAVDVTVFGLEGLIRNAEKELSQIEQLNKMLGEKGAEFRRQGWEMWVQSLETFKLALKLRKAAGGS